MDSELQNEACRPAEPGALAPAVYANLLRAAEFTRERRAIMSGLYPRRLRHSALREELVSYALLEYGAGRERCISQFARHCDHLGSISAVRNELRYLATMGILHLRGNPSDRRGIRVVPTAAAVRFFNENVPTLSAIADRIFGR